MPFSFSILRNFTLAVAALAGLAVSATSATAQDPYFMRGCPGCKPQVYGQPDLFANYYVPPTCGGVGAQAYVAPGPVPAHVGHTYVTYQPFMPHEMLYPHHQTFHRYYDEGRGVTRTHVTWKAPPVKTTWQHVHHGLRLAR